MEVTKTCKTCGVTATRQWYSGPLCKNCYHKLPSGRARKNAWARKYARTPNGLYSQHRKACKNRQITTTLTFEEFHSLRGPCHYCSAEPPVCGAGLDRIAHSKGYTVDNVIPCCSNCNYLRGDLLTVNETKELVHVLKRLRRVRKKSPWKKPA
jgi:hypothetical protein